MQQVVDMDTKKSLRERIRILKEMNETESSSFTFDIRERHIARLAKLL